MAEENQSVEQRSSAAPLGLGGSGEYRKTKTFGQKVLIVFATLVLIVFAFILAAMNAERIENNEKKENSNIRNSRRNSLADASQITGDLWRASIPKQVAPTLTTAPPKAPEPTNKIIVVQPPKRRAAVMTDADRELARKIRDMRLQSLTAQSAVGGFMDSGSNKDTAQSTQQRGLGTGGILDSVTLDEAERRLKEVMASSGGGEKGEAQRKLDFLLTAQDRTPQGYSKETRMPPLTRMELKAGSVIPGMLVAGLDSDLPGMAIGQVSENVYDSATGRYLLIPQGTRVIGVYDSQTSYGQKRINVVWNRLIYPDGSTLNIAGSPGADMAGFAGIKGKVDNHYGQLFTAVLFTSVFAAVAEAATGGEDTENSNSNKKSVKDVMVETAGAVIADLGARMANRALNIQPTIRVKPGSRFNIMVQQDVAFLYAWTRKGEKK